MQVKEPLFDYTQPEMHNVLHLFYKLFFLIFCLVLVVSCRNTSRKEAGKTRVEGIATNGHVSERMDAAVLVSETSSYYVAAYVWPSCHDDGVAREKFWSEGIGEWEMVQKGTSRFEGHYQPRIPLWGYESDDDPEVMQKWIDVATQYGVNTFIFDWYWYDGQPFLEGTVNAFVAAPNTEQMHFYLMWANHDVPGNMWNYHRYPTDSLIFEGAVDRKNYQVIMERVIRQYFKRPNYLKIDGCPVFSIYHLGNLIKSFGTIEGARNALDLFRDEVRKAGFPDLHVQLIAGDDHGKPVFWGMTEVDDVNAIVNALGVNSVTFYNMAGGYVRKEDYVRYGEAAVPVREKWHALLDVPFFPCVSVGWDDTPRYPLKGREDVIYLNQTPDQFGLFLHQAKEYADRCPNQPKLIVINAWNEWIEGSYLLPDSMWNYQFLETVKQLFVDSLPAPVRAQ